MCNDAKYSGFSITENAIMWTGDGEYLRIEAWGENSVRVRSSVMRERLDEDWVLLPPAESSKAVIRKDEDTAELTNGQITVIAKAFNQPEEGRCDCRLTFKNQEGAALFAETERGGSLLLQSRSFLSRPGGSYRVKASFTVSESEHLYGMGEYQQAIVDLKGHDFELAHRNSQASVPFVVSSKGYGFLWNNPAIGSASFAKDTMTWTANTTDGLDYWVTAGADYKQIESQYAIATGHAPSMPEWGLGFWHCKLRYWNQQQVLDVARGFKERNIPLDLIVIDFFHWPHMGDFRFETEFWPDPKSMCEELHDMGIKVMVSVWPQVSLKSENYSDMKQRNLLAKARHGVDVGMMFVEPCQFYDATNPRARDYVWNKCSQNYVANGIDAFWLDEAEPEWSTYSYENYSYYRGDVEKIGNLYPSEYNRGFYEGQQRIGRDGDIVNLTRCAWAGTQRYGALVWSGDVGSTFQDLRAQITCAINMGMAGIPWFTTDMGGFHSGVIDSPEFRDLLARWCQFSCFLPVMRNHGDRSLHTKTGKEHIYAADGSPRLQSGADNEPWSYGDEIERIMIKYINIREHIRPYVRELFEQAHVDGQPLVRGLFFEFPKDEAAHSITDEYMFGPDLLIAPVTQQNAVSREVYLPDDGNVKWTELHTGTIYDGGRRVRVEAPRDVLPVFARNGADHGLSGLI